MKNYDREYERVFTGTDIITRKCDIDKITIKDESPVKSVDQYIEMLKDTISIFELNTFNFLVKYLWLVRKFQYDGVTRRKHFGNGHKLETAFGVFMRHYVSTHNKMITGPANWLSKIIHYLDDFFPAFDLGNPFEQEYEYPFKFMNFSCLFLVYQMDERMDLLAHGEKHKMNYTEFNDYILNYTLCYNEEHGSKKYIYTYSRQCPQYIKNKESYYGNK